MTKEIDISKKLNKIKEQLIKDGKVIPATYDTMFKIVMSSSPAYVTFLISEFTNIDKDDLVKNIIIQNNELPLSNAKERKKISDFIAKIDKSLINFEMNSEYYDGLLIRNQAYLGKLEGESLNASESFSNMQRFLQVNFNNFTHFKSDKSILEFVYTDKDTLEIETENLKKYHISLPKLEKKYYNGDKLSKLEKALLILKLDKISDLEEISKGDEDLMEAVEKIKEATFDINTIGLYDAEKDRKWKEEAKLAYREKIGVQKGRELGREEGIELGREEGIELGREEGRQEGLQEGQASIITTMLNNGIKPKNIVEMTGVPFEKVKKMGLL